MIESALRFVTVILLASSVPDVIFDALNDVILVLATCNLPFDIVHPPIVPEVAVMLPVMVAFGTVILPLNVISAEFVPPEILLTAKEVMLALAICKTPLEI